MFSCWIGSRGRARRSRRHGDGRHRRPSRIAIGVVRPPGATATVRWTRATAPRPPGRRAPGPPAAGAPRPAMQQARPHQRAAHRGHEVVPVAGAERRVRGSRANGSVPEHDDHQPGDDQPLRPRPADGAQRTAGDSRATAAAIPTRPTTSSTRRRPARRGRCPSPGGRRTPGARSAVVGLDRLRRVPVGHDPERRPPPKPRHRRRPPPTRRVDPPRDPGQRPRPARPHGRTAS